MFHAPVEISHVGGCPSCRRVFHGDAPSRGQHRPGDFIDRNSPNNPSLRGPSDLGNPNSFSDLSKLGSRGDRSNPSSFSNPNSLSLSSPRDPSNRSDYSSEASSFIPSSIRDLSRNEKFSLIVLRWLPSG